PLAAFRAALRAGAEMIETDIRRGRGGDLVLAHGRPPAASRPARLAQLVELAGDRVALDLELKEPGLERDLLRAVADRPPGLIITSFLPQVVEVVGRLDSEIQTGILARPGMATPDLVRTAP